MAPVPTDQSVVLPTAGAIPYQSAQATPQSFGAQIGTADVQSGQQTMQTADAEAQQALVRQQDYNEAATGNALVAASQQLSQIESGLKQKVGGDAMGALPASQDQARQVYSQARATLPNDMTQRMFDASMGRQLNASLGSMADWANQQTVVYQQQALKAQIANQQTLIAQHAGDPARMSQDIDGLVTMAVRQGLASGANPNTPEGRQIVSSALSNYTSSAMTVAVRSLTDGEPAAAQALYDRYSNATIPGTAQLNDGQEVQDTGLPMISPADRVTLEAELDRAQQQGQASLRASVAQQYQDELAAREFRGTGVGLNVGQLAAAFPDKAPEMIAALNRATTSYNLRTGAALTSPQEDAATLARLQPNGPGFADQVGTLQQQQQVLAQKYRALDSDPAAYVRQASPALSQAFQAAAGDPSQLPKALAMSAALQAQVGVPPDQVRALDKGQAASLVAGIAKLPPEAQAGALRQQQSSFGSYWPSAYRDLVAAGLPPQSQILANIAPTDQAGQYNFATAMAADPKDLAAAAGGNKGDIDQAVDSGLAPLHKTLMYAGDGDQKYAQYADATRRLAYHLSASQDPASAAASAVATVVGNNYDFVTAPGFAARAPKGTAPTVERFADQILGGLRPGDLSAPGIGSGAPQALQDQYAASHLADVRRNPLWVTTPNDDGWLLLNRRTGQPVVRADGRTPVQFPFAAAGVVQ